MSRQIAEHFAAAALAQLFENAKDYPQPLKTRVLECKLEVRDLITRAITDAIAQARAEAAPQQPRRIIHPVSMR